VGLKDVFGDGELLFARKFSDDSIELLQRMDDIIEQKERSLLGSELCESEKTASAERH
jgi:hypothetical protein